MLRRLVGRLAATVGSCGWGSEADERGQSELVGTVLILGLSMAVIGTSVALGGVALGDLVSTAEADNVENGMSHLSSQVSLVALGDADSQRFSLGQMREGTVSVEPGAGNITISNVTDDSRDELFETELGAIVYTGPNREVAYQGGGLWTKYDDNSSLASPPEYHYRGTTLTLPIIQVTGEGAVGGQPSGRITPVDVGTDAIPDVSTPLEKGTIEVKIQSEYYEGWNEYLSQRTEGETEVYHSNQTVVSRLTVPDRVTFDTALSVSAPYDPKNAGVDSVEDNVAHRSARPLIERRVSEANESGVNSDCLGNSSCELDAGTYFYDGDLALSDDLNLDTSSGNITIIVDGSLDINDNDVTLTDNSTPKNGVTYYVDGSLRAQGDGFVGTDDPDVPDDRSVPEADRNVFYVADGFLDDSSGDGTIRFDAVVYAPDAALNIAGTPDITGALVVDRVEKLKGDSKIEYDSTLSGTTIELTGAADLLKYLHVSHNEVRVDLD